VFVVLSRIISVFFKNFLEIISQEVFYMKIIRFILLFSIGGAGYMGLECLWRGWSHYSMFLAGGACFLLLGKLDATRPRLPLPLRGLVGAGIITMIELLAGLLFNRSYQVWDYRHLPVNFHGQICLRFFLLWIPISLGAMWLYTKLQRLPARPGTTAA
jgi:hypothetical protein